MSSRRPTSKSAQETANGRPADSASASSQRNYNTRGHRLFRATQTSKEELTPLLNFLRHTQGWVTAVTAVGVIWTSRAESVYYVAGALVTSTLAKLLKKVIREERPEGSAVTRTSGMPSTHSSTVTFMCSYLAFYAFTTSWPLTLALAAFPPLVMWSRVQLGVHTPRQVVVGGILGFTSALVIWAQWNGHWPSISDAARIGHSAAGWRNSTPVIRFDAWVAGLKRRVLG